MWNFRHYIIYIRRERLYTCLLYTSAQKKKLAKEEETLSQEIKKKKELSHKLEEAEAKKIALQKEETEATEKKLLAKEQFDRCQAAYTAVSYTHLDVYKRQIRNPMVNSLHSR